MRLNEDYVTITKHKDKYDSYLLSSKHPILKNRNIRCDIYEKHMVITIATIDYNGKTYKVSKRSSGWRQFALSSDKLIEGKFYIDLEDSTEDKVYVDFNL